MKRVAGRDGWFGTGIEKDLWSMGERALPASDRAESLYNQTNFVDPTLPRRISIFTDFMIT